MNVTVEMSAEDFVDFCAYQKDRNAFLEKLSRKHSRSFKSLKRQHRALCNLVLSAFEVVPSGVGVVDVSAALRAMELAEDYFA